MSERVGARLRRRRGGAAVYAGSLSLVVLALAGAVGLATRQPWLFPSLGPTVMLFFESPENASSRPRNALVGHGVGLVVGAACFYVLGLNGQPVPSGGLTASYLVAGALSVAITTTVLTLLKTPHPPAGATTLIVSLGILTQPAQLAAMAGAIVLITVAGWGLNRVLLGADAKR